MSCFPLSWCNRADVRKVSYDHHFWAFTSGVDEICWNLGPWLPSEFWNGVCKRLIWKKYFEIQIFLHTLQRTVFSNFAVEPDRVSSWSSQSRDMWRMFSSAFCTGFVRCYLPHAGWLLALTPPTHPSISSFPLTPAKTIIKLLLLCPHVIFFLLAFCPISLKPQSIQDRGCLVFCVCKLCDRWYPNWRRALRHEQMNFGTSWWRD